MSGVYSGVGFLSSFPCKPAPHSWPAEVYATSRVQVAHFFAEPLWILGGVAYGYVADQGLVSSVVISIWRLIALTFWLLGTTMAFVEIQDFLQRITGSPPQVTCKHRTRKDFLFISRELQALFIEATVDHTFFAGHAVLAARFRWSGDTVPRFIWRMPSHRPCSATASVSVPSTGWIPPRTSPSDTYLSVCQEFEARLSSTLHNAGAGPLQSRERGRASTRDVRCQRGVVPPAPRARDGEVQPQYFGQNLRHTHWFRQLRRIPSVCAGFGSGQFCSFCR